MSPIRAWVASQFPGGQTIKTMTITPQVAAMLLAVNLGNRRLVPNLVDRYARLMATGRFVENTDCIGLGSDFRLMNGQHRLTACIQSGCSFTATVKVGIDPDAFHVLDNGRPRQKSDLLSIAGHPSSKVLAAVATLLFRYEQGDLTGRNVGVEADQMFELIDRYPEIHDAVLRGHSCRGVMTASLAAFGEVLFARQDPALARAFFDKLASGESLAAGSPVLALRNRLLADRVSKAKLPQAELIALMFKAWKAFRDGKKVTTLRWRSEGPRAEAFPSIAA